MAEEFNISKASEETVLIDRADDFIRENHCPLPDLIKLDVQGYELEVLLGARDCLRHAEAIIAEVAFVEYYSRQCFFEDVVEFLAARGFRVSALSVRTALGKPLTQTDVLFLRPH